MDNRVHFDLSGQVVLVTGTSGTLGQGLSRAFHPSGARVVMQCAANRAPLEALARELGSRVAVVVGDIQRDAEHLLDQATSACGLPTTLINNAGIQPVEALLSLTDAQVGETLRVNVEGTVALTNRMGRRWVADARPGCIVNVASIEGLQPASGHSHYAASKAAVIMHTRAAALELGPYRIRVNAVAPGLIERRGLAQDWPEGVERWLAHCPLGRIGRPQDVANAVLFLASDAASWITGQTLVVDGGMLTHNVW